MPTTDTPWPDGTPCWIDYSAADADAAKTFYGGIFGWDFLGSNAEYGNYDNALLGGRAVAGMAPRMDDSQPAQWTTYFATSDADAAAARITDAGGTLLVPPMEVGPLGTMTVAAGTQGEVFGLWQAGQHTGVRVFNEPGALVWNEAAVEDPDAARAFYAAVFGFAYDEVEGVSGYTTFRTGDRPLGGLGGVQPGLPTGWTACWCVASADSTIAAVEAAGGKLLAGPEDMDYGRYAVLQDPWGAPFTVLQEPPA